MTAYLDAHYAIVSIPLLAIFCATIVVGNLVAAFLHSRDGWVRRGLVTAGEQCFGAIGVFILGYFFWRGL